MKKILLLATMFATITACRNTSVEYDKKKQNEIAAVSADTTVVTDNMIMEKSDNEESPSQTTNFIPPKVIRSEEPIDIDRKIIKTADIKLEVENFESFNTNIRKSIKHYGAYIAQEEQQNTDLQLQNNITVKVPADRFEDLINTFGGTGIKVLERNISTTDASEEYIDAKARMEARKQVRARYLELLKSAHKMSDVLSIEQEINSTQEEVEAATGKMKFIQHQAAYSTVHLTYLQYLSGKAPEDPTYFTRLVSAVKEGFNVTGNVVLVFVYLWPLVIVALIIWYLAKRYLSRKKKQTQAVV